MPREFFEVPLDPEVEAAVRKAIDLLGEMGAQVSEVSWPTYHHSVSISSTILMAEATACHADLVRDHGPQLYPPVRTRLESGFFISAADYVQAQRARTLLVQESRELLREVDILAGPALPVTAPTIGATRLQVGDSTVGATARPHPVHSGLQRQRVPRHQRALWVLSGRAPHWIAAGGQALR